MPDIVIRDHTIKPGERIDLKLPVAKLYTAMEVDMPVHVVRAKKPGPTVFVSAAVHGDELNGIEIIRRLRNKKGLKLVAGTIILVPMVNVYGVLDQSRYMPDRRDLNRCFPGSARGSLAGRVANSFLNDIVKQCDYGIDLHTGAIHRSNLPQIRANLDDAETRSMAEAFGVPVLLNANLRDGSLRQSALESGIKMLLYEAGEALRFDELSIRAGLKGIINVLELLGLIRKKKTLKASSRSQTSPFIANDSAWVRATASGIVTVKKNLGDQVTKGEVLADIGTPLGELLDDVKAPRSGIIIGQQNIPLVQEGDAMFHIAYFKGKDEKVAEVAEHIEKLQDELLPD